MKDFDNPIHGVSLTAWARTYSGTLSYHSTGRRAPKSAARHADPSRGIQGHTRLRQEVIQGVICGFYLRESAALNNTTLY